MLHNNAASQQSPASGLATLALSFDVVEVAMNKHQILDANKRALLDDRLPAFERLGYEGWSV